MQLLNRNETICGLFAHHQEIKGRFELKLVDTVGWIESAGLLTNWQGKGLGKAGFLTGKDDSGHAGSNREKH
jgi:hypothetical protein